MPAHRRTTLARRCAAVALLAAATLTGCGGTEPDPQVDDAAESTSATPSPDEPSATVTDSASTSPSPTESPTTSEPAPDPGTRIEVRIAGGEVEPSGERVRVKLGEPITVVIDSDQPGEMHVHATPEVEWPFDAGSSRQRFELTQPGIVEMELHDPAVTVVQLEAR